MDPEAAKILDFAVLPLVKAVGCQLLSLLLLLLMASDIKSTIQLGGKRIAFMTFIAQAGFFLAPILFMPTGWMSVEMKYCYYVCALLAAFLGWMITEPFLNRTTSRGGLRLIGGVAFVIIYAPLWVGIIQLAN